MCARATVRHPGSKQCSQLLVYCSCFVCLQAFPRAAHAVYRTRWHIQPVTQQSMPAVISDTVPVNQRHNCCWLQMQVLQWCRAQQPACPFDEWACCAAAEAGSIAALVWLRSQTPPCPWNGLTCAAAAGKGCLPSRLGSSGQ
jgi:hypothetical protein